MSITVRPAQGADAEGVVSLLCDIADLHHNGRPDIFRSGFSKYDIPEYLQSPLFKGYKYPHDYENHYVEQKYLPKDIQNRTYYKFGNNKIENNGQNNH